jgi:hypothetical protein
MVARIAPVASIGYGGAQLGNTGPNDGLNRLLGKMALGIYFAAPAAKSATAVHASIAGTTSVVPVTTGITNPAIPRNLTATMAASWDGGNISIVGTDQFDQPQTETITGTAASTVVGVKVWKTITSVAHTAVGVNAAGYSVGTGDKLGLGVKCSVGNGFIIGTKDGVGELMVLDVANAGFTPTTVPNAAINYQVLVSPE